MARFLVAGGAGFIGSHIAEELVRRGESVCVLDDFSTGKEENLRGVAGQIALIRADIRKLEEIRPHFRGVDYVIHEAGRASVLRSIEDPIGANAVNIDGTLNVLVAARDAGVRRVVFAASSSVYGDGHCLPRVENQPPRPLSPYALAKLTGEYYCQLFDRLYGLETVSLRYFNIFGPRQDPNSPYSGVIAAFVASFVLGKGPLVHGDGTQVRDFTYVANAVDATIRATVTEGVSGQVMNVGSGEAHSLLEVIEKLKKIFGRDLKPTFGPLRPGDIHASYSDIRLARSLLGYEPAVGFEEGLRRTVEWVRARQE
jgi:UDP-glucose 4-epimerase